MKTKKSFVKFVSAFVMALMLCVSFGVCSGFTVKADTQQAAEAQTVSAENDGIALYSVTSNGTDVTGLGYSVDAVTAPYLDAKHMKDGAPVFEVNWLKAQIEKGTHNATNTTNTASYSGSNYNTMKKAYADEMQFSNSVTGQCDVFTASLSSGYETSTTMNYASTASQYYFRLHSEYEKYTYSLPGYTADRALYQANFGANYVNDMAKLLNNQMTADAFFGRYGTHIVMKGIYGGKIELHYSALSNKIDVGNAYKNKIDSALKISNTEMGSADTKFTFDLQTAIGRSTESVSEMFRAKAVGGNAFEGVGIQNLNSHFSSWIRSVGDRPALIGATSDGLVPLWDILPTAYDTSANAAKVKALYNTYAQNHYPDAGINRNFAGLTENTYTTEQKFIRSAEYTIKDTGFDKQPYDEINLDSLSEYSHAILRHYGYKNMQVNLTLDMKQKDNGYQWFLMCFDVGSKENSIILEYEHPFSSHSYVTEHITIPTMSTSHFTDTLVIRYSASGKFDDTWYNKNLYVSITYSK